MNLDISVKGLLDAREKLRNAKGIVEPSFISESMQRMAVYNSSVEEALADLEEELEVEEEKAYRKHINNGLSPSAAEREAKYDVAKLKASAKRLTRLVNSSWKLIGTAQSRWNHITKEQQTGEHTT